MLKSPETKLSGGLNALDITIIVLILIWILMVGIYASIKAESFRLCANKKQVDHPTEEEALDTKRASSTNLLLQNPASDMEEEVRKNKATNFFLADRSMSFYLVGASLFASNIGSEHFIGQAGAGAKRGLAVAMYEWYAAILLLPLGWVFAPIYRRAQVYTTPEFLQRRFSAPCRHYLSAITCIMYILTKMSASIYGGAVVLSSTLGWDLYLSAGVCILLSALYTVTGGLRAVMYTDLLQMIIFVTGGFVVLGFALRDVGGINGLQDRLAQDGKSDFWHLFKPASDEDYPWTGMLIGQPIGSLWYWCMDQDLVQRVIASKDRVHAKAGCVMASLLKLLPPFIMIIPGIITAVLYDMEKSTNQFDDAYPVLLTNIVPHGVIGLMIASIMTAMMSSLDSVFNAGSTVVTNDIYLVLRPNASQKSLVWVGRLATVGFAILSFCWIPILSNGSSLYRRVVEVQGYLTPPVGIVLLIGVLWRRANHQGALTGLLVGGALGMIRLIIAVGFPELKGTFPVVIEEFFFMNFQHFAILLWVVSGGLCIGVSLCTPSPAPEKNVDLYTIQWHEVFSWSEEEKAYPQWILHFLIGAALSSLVATFTLWIVYA